jgi:hypothetical protein
LQARFAVWIDAASPESALRIFGMSLVERQLAALAQLAAAKDAGFAIASVTVEHAPGAAPTLRADLAARFGVKLAPASGPLGERLARAAAASAGATLLALPGDAILDTRVLAELLRGADGAAALGGEGGQRTALVRLAANAQPAPSRAAGLRAYAEEQLSAGALRELRDDAQPRARSRRPSAGCSGPTTRARPTSSRAGCSRLSCGPRCARSRACVSTRTG